MPPSPILEKIGFTFNGGVGLLLNFITFIRYISFDTFRCFYEDSPHKRIKITYIR